MSVRQRTCGCAAAALLAATSLAACGGANGTPRAGSGAGEADRGARGEEADRQAAKAKLPAADRIAFYQLATTIGLLRGSAAAAAQGRPGGAAIDEQLAAAASRVAALRPRDRVLAALRDRLAAIMRSRPAGNAGPAAARATLAATAGLIADLQRYARSRPEYQALVPD